MKNFVVLVVFGFLLLNIKLSAQTLSFEEQGWNSNQKLISNFTAGVFTFSSNKNFWTNYGFNLNVNNTSIYFIFQNSSTDQVTITTANNQLINLTSIAAYQVSEAGNDTLIVEGWNQSNMTYTRKYAGNSLWKILSLNYNNINKIVIKSARSGLYDYNFDNFVYTPVSTIARKVIKLNANSGTGSGDSRLGSMTGMLSTRAVYFIGTKGGVTYKVNIPETGQWYAWARMYYKSSGGKNSFFLYMNSKQYILGDNDGKYNTWYWDGYNGSKISIGTLTAGINTLKISGSEPGLTLWIDQILLTNDPNYNPNTASKEEYIADAELQEEVSSLPSDFKLDQNYPNPFNPSTNISFTIPDDNFVNLTVYDMLGNQIAVLVNENKSSGRYEVKFDAQNLASGIYYYAIKAGNFNLVKKMMLIK